jgi:EF-hand domain-containing protein 1
VVILGRRFLIYDCDNFTKAWYYQHFGMTYFTPVQLVGPPDVNRATQSAQMEIGPYSGLGSLEDSMASALSVQPKPPKLDYVKQVDNGTKTLRYEAMLDSIKPQDKGRRFIISYRLADDMINIYEPPVRNSGIIGGTFLSRARIAKPGSTMEKPEYYGPQDFNIGAKVEAFGNRFIITNADKYVLKFLEAHSDQVSPSVIQSLRERLSQDDAIRQHHNYKGAPVHVIRQDGDLLRMMREIKSQLKKMTITDKARIDEMFLRYNTSREGFITVKHLQDMCRKMQLPDDEDVISALMEESGANGKMNLEQFRKFFEH